jgi:hypothetical protein
LAAIFPFSAKFAKMEIGPVICTGVVGGALFMESRMRSLFMRCLPILAIFASGLSSTLHAAPLSDADISHLYKQVDERRLAIMRAEADDPFPSPVCDGTKNGQHCVLGKINQSLALFYLGRDPKDIATANQELGEAVTALPKSNGYNEDVEAEDSAAISQGEDWEPFHFMRAGLIYRIVRFFGADGSLARGRLTPANETAIDAVFWDWANGNCRMDDTAATHLWTPWKTENHDAQHDATCWEAAELFRHSPQYSDRRYGDGSSAADQYRQWTSYLKSYIRARARWGLIEFFSPTYARYTLANIYSYADFSDDPELKRVAREFLDLWWAEWAQEQLGGVFGGAQTRVYVERVPEASPMQGVSWMYFGEGGAVKDGREPGYSQSTTSTYVPPPVVVDLAMDTAGRGTYDVYAQAPGLLASGGRRSGTGDRRFTVDPNEPAILRIAHVTSDYIMSSSVAAKRPFNDWIPDSAQNRLVGVIMSNDLQARVVVDPQGIKTPKNYNALWAVQSKATQIVQETSPPYSKNTGDMRIWFGAPLSKTERNGWVFVEGSAYLAVRPASGGYHWDSSEPNWFVVDDSTSPVILQAGSKSEYPNFTAFQDAVLNAPLRVEGNTVTFQGLGGAGKLTSYGSPNRQGEIDGVPIDIASSPGLRSPFVNQDRGSTQVRISKGSREETLDF